MTDLRAEHRYIGVTESGDEWAPRPDPDGLKREMEHNPVGSCWPGSDDRYDALVSIRHETRLVGDWTPVAPPTIATTPTTNGDR